MGMTQRIFSSVFAAVFLILAGGAAWAVCKKKTEGYFKQMEVTTAVATAVGTTTSRTIKGIPNSLTGRPGDPVRGKKLALNRKKGNCLACHRISALSNYLFHGEVGPKLDGVGKRYPEAILRQLLVDSRVYYPKTLMPSFYVKSDAFHDVAPKFRGKTILTAQEVEDIVAFMKTL